VKKLLILSMLSLTFSQVYAAEPRPEGMPPPNAKHGPNHDGFDDKDITRAEFLKRGSEHFDQLDTNHDGVLSKEERKAGHEAMLEKMKEHRRRAPDQEMPN
jgi:hypothetical protein